MIHLRRPEPLLFSSVCLVQCLPFIFPCSQVIRRIASDTIAIVRAVSIVLAVLQQNVGVGQGYLTNFALRSCYQRQHKT